jgi:hypothetical protein
MERATARDKSSVSVASPCCSQMRTRSKAISATGARSGSPRSAAPASSAAQTRRLMLLRSILAPSPTRSGLSSRPKPLLLRSRLKPRLSLPSRVRVLAVSADALPSRAAASWRVAIPNRWQRLDRGERRFIPAAPNYFYGRQTCAAAVRRGFCFQTDHCLPVSPEASENAGNQRDSVRRPD